MVKRIPCRVVRSAPLWGEDASRAGRGGDEGFGQGDGGADKVGFESGSNSTSYTFHTSAARAPVAENAAGRMLDCYA